MENTGVLLKKPQTTSDKNLQAWNCAEPTGAQSSCITVLCMNCWQQTIMQHRHPIEFSHGAGTETLLYKSPGLSAEVRRQPDTCRQLVNCVSFPTGTHWPQRNTHTLKFLSAAKQSKQQCSRFSIIILYPKRPDVKCVRFTLNMCLLIIITRFLQSTKYKVLTNRPLRRREASDMKSGCSEPLFNSSTA